VAWASSPWKHGQDGRATPQQYRKGAYLLRGLLRTPLAGLIHFCWPGSASFNWSEICTKDSGAKFVFGTARIYTSYWNTEPVEEAEVPYASEEYFRKHGSYNLTMRLRALNTQRGKRWYVWAGN